MRNAEWHIIAPSSRDRMPGREDSDFALSFPRPSHGHKRNYENEELDWIPSGRDTSEAELAKSLACSEKACIALCKRSNALSRLGAAEASLAMRRHCDTSGKPIWILHSVWHVT